MSARSYIIALACCASLLALLVTGINYVVDPYGVTGAPRIAGVNLHKPDINERVRLAKKYQPLRGTFNTVIVGNSRVEMGIDPAHRCFAELGLSPYNIGVPGAGIRRQLEYALNVVHGQPVRRVFIGLDFFDFIASAPQAPGNRNSFAYQQAGDFRYLPAGGANPGYRDVALKDYYQALFSLDALTSSVRTVLLQDESSPDRDDSGFNPARDMAAAVSIEGPRALFDQKMSELQASYARERVLFAPGETTNTPLLHVAEFLDIADNLALEVDIFIAPFHRWYQDLLQRKELLPAYERWREEVASLVRARSPDTVRLWLFDDDPGYTNESVPAAGARTEPLRWFWEPSHYRSELGDLMVQTMLSEQCGSEAVFGYPGDPAR